MRSPRPDFLHPVRGASPWAWLALPLALGVLADAGHDATQAWQARQAAQRAFAAPAPTPAPAPKPDAEAQRALRQAQARLVRPWPAAFAGIESLRQPGLRWLALSIGEEGRLQLEGMAPDASSAIALAEALRRHPAWRDVVPGRIDNEMAAGAAVRFELTATLAGASP